MKKKIIAIVLAAALCLGVVIFLPTTADVSAEQGCWIKNEATEHYYRLTEPMGWLQAEAEAVELGGHLVTINDEEEELWLREVFGEVEHFKIGFNDIDAEGTWVWASGESDPYTNWDEEEPNNTHPGEDGAVMNDTPQTGTGFGWNDQSIESEHRAIVEAEEIVSEPSHEPMTGQKLIGQGSYAEWKTDGIHNILKTTLILTNPDCVGEITVDQISVFAYDGTVLYEGPLLHWRQEIPWTEPMEPHETRESELDQYVPDCFVWPTEEGMLFTAEIFWSGAKDGLPLTGYVSTAVIKRDLITHELVDIEFAGVIQMVNMNQVLTPVKEEKPK